MSDQPVDANTQVAPQEEVPQAGAFVLRRAWGDVIISVALLAVAIWFFITAGGIEDYSGEGIGAADFPRGISLLLGIGAVCVLVGAVRRLAMGNERRQVIVRRYGHVAVGMVLFIAFPVLMRSVGYYWAMAPWLAAFLLLAGERRPLHVAAYVAGFLLFTKVIFEIILGTPLP
jgi:hypothetical protein